MNAQKSNSRSERETVTAEISRDLQYRLITADLGFFRLTHTVTALDTAPANLRGRYPETTEYGFARMSDICAFADDEILEIPVDSELTAVPPEFLELVAREGLSSPAFQLSSSGVFREKAWLQFSTGELTAKNLVRWCDGTWLLFDLEGKPLPVAILFNHKLGQLSDMTYDLNAVVRILATNGQVSPQITGVYGEVKPADALRIRYIDEHDLISGVREKTVTFLFTPTPEEMVKIWEQAQKLYPKNASSVLASSVMDLDLLGLRAGGASKR